MKDDAMGEACSMYIREMYDRVFQEEKLKERDH
jgi:hypothetical protein